MKRIIFSAALLLACWRILAQEIELAVPRHHTQIINSLCLSTDGKFLLTASADQTIILREVSTGNYLRAFEIGTSIWEVKFLADSRHFIVNTSDGIFIYNIGKKKLLQTITGPFNYMRVNKTRNEFIAQKSTGALSLYQNANGQFNYSRTLDSMSSRTRTFFNYSADGKKILILKNGIQILDIGAHTKKTIPSFGIPDSLITSVALHLDNNTLAIGLGDGSISLCDLKLKTKTASLRAYTNYWKGIMYKGIVKDSVSLKDPVRDLEFIDANNLVSYHSPHASDYTPGTTHFPSYGSGEYVDPEDLDKMWDDLQHELDEDKDNPFQTKDLWGWRPTLIAWNLEKRKADYLTSTSDPLSINANSVATSRTLIHLKTRQAINIGGENTIVNRARFSFSGNRLLLNKNYVNSIMDLTSGVTSGIAYTLHTEDFSCYKNFIGIQKDNGYYSPTLMDIDSRKNFKTLGHINGTHFFYNPEKEQITFRTYNDSIIVQDFNGKRLFGTNGNYGTVHEFSMDGTLFTLNDNTRTWFYETDHFTLVDSLPRYNEFGGYERVGKSVAFRNLIYIDYGDMVIVRNIALKKTVDTLHLKIKGALNTLDLSPDGNQLAVGSTSGEIIFLDLKKKSTKAIHAHEQVVNVLDFNADGRILISAGNDGLMKFWDVATQTILAQLLFYGDDWVVVNPDGLFDGSAGGLAKLFFINGLQTIELSQLKDRFYEPGLLSKVLGLSKEQLRKSQGLRNIRLFPKIDLTLPDENATMIANVTSQGGGIGRVKFFINGKEAMADARGVAHTGSKDNISIRFSLANHPFLKTNEVNVIEVRAFNEDEYLESPAKKVYYLAPGASQTSISLYGVVIGTSDYNGTQLDLRYAAKDAEQMGFALSETSSKLFGTNQVNIEVLTTNTKDKWPTKSNIKKVFANFSQRAKPNDILIVYLAGHGLNYGSEESDFYYLTADAQNGNLQDPVVREEVAISSHEFTEYIKMVPALKQIMILDACHSGKFAEDLLAKREVKSAGEIRALERMKDRTGMFILSGSAADAVSYEASSFGQGLLTYSLLLGIKGAALRDKQYLDVMGLFQYCVDVVPQFAQNIGGIQKPELRVPYAAESFDIGMLDDQINKKIILPSPKPVFIRSLFQDEDTFGDPLELSDQLDALLKTSRSDSQSATIIFIDASKYSDGFSLRGRYKKSGDKYEVTFKLLKGDRAIKDFHANEIKPEELATKIMKLVNDLAAMELVK
jgi:WD40 repeat protein